MILTKKGLSENADNITGDPYPMTKERQQDHHIKKDNK